MGFFGSMKSIRSIYAKLNEIEPMFTSMERTLSRGDVHGAKILAFRINTALNDLTAELETVPNSVQCAEFRFLGSNYPIYHIVRGIRETIQPCLLLR